MMQKTPKLVPPVQGAGSDGRQDNGTAKPGGLKRRLVYLAVILVILGGAWVAIMAKYTAYKEKAAAALSEQRALEQEAARQPAPVDGAADGPVTSRVMETDPRTTMAEGTDAQRLHIAALERRAAELSALVEKQEAQLKMIATQTLGGAGAKGQAAMIGPFLPGTVTADASPTSTASIAPSTTTPSATVDALGVPPVLAPMQLQALQAHMDQLTQRLASVEAQKAVGSDASFRLLALVWQIERKIEAGEPFREELIALQQRAMAVETPQGRQVRELAATLEESAREGVAQPQELYWDYRALAGPLAGQLRKAEGKEGGGWVDFLGGLVTVRRVDDPGIGDGDALLTRLETALQAGDLDLARKEAVALRERVAKIAHAGDREKAERWLARLQQAAAARDTVNALALALTAEG